MCPRDFRTDIKNLSAGDYIVEVVREAHDGTSETVASLPFECMDAPTDWEYEGVTCVN